MTNDEGLFLEPNVIAAISGRYEHCNWLCVHCFPFSEASYNKHMHTNTVYNHNAPSYAQRYESVAFEDVHTPLLEHIEKLGKNSFILDIGAGSGRDATWFASRGHEVFAVEPSHSMRAEAQRLHSGTSIKWIDDSLPVLAGTHRLGISFDFIFLSAVWMHVRPEDRSQAMRKLVTLINPGGSIAISLRFGPPDFEREMHEVTEHELDILAMEHGLRKLDLSLANTTDKLGRGDISWQTVLYELPDDGLGGLPLLRHIILRDDKSSTYKLALLRIVARIASTAGGIAEIKSCRDGQDYAVIPMGLVALYWLRAFLPLIKSDLPQMPMNKAGKGLGFVKNAFNTLLDLAPQDFKAGMPFLPEKIQPLQQALNDATLTIARAPVHYITDPTTQKQVFLIKRGRSSSTPPETITKEYLKSFGDFYIPLYLWKALVNYAIWVEPVIVMEWARLIENYLNRQGSNVDERLIRKNLLWIDPERDVKIIRSQVERLRDEGHTLWCIWSNKKLGYEYEVDHCFPYSVWPCDDLWNLYPTNPKANQRKSDKLVTRDLLHRSQDRIFEWWELSFLGKHSSSREQFLQEVQLSLPLQNVRPEYADIFNAMDMHRTRMKQIFRLPEWNGL